MYTNPPRVSPSSAAATTQPRTPTVPPGPKTAASSPSASCPSSFPSLTSASPLLFPLPHLTSTNINLSRFLTDSAAPIEDDFPDAPSPADILGARLVGRWKSGAPLRITPLVDDPELAADPMRNNKFKFNPDSQEICPFAAHIRTSLSLSLFLRLSEIDYVVWYGMVCDGC